MRHALLVRPHGALLHHLRPTLSLRRPTSPKTRCATRSPRSPPPMKRPATCSPPTCSPARTSTGRAAAQALLSAVGAPGEVKRRSEWPERDRALILTALL